MLVGGHGTVIFVYCFLFHLFSMFVPLFVTFPPFVLPFRMFFFFSFCPSLATTASFPPCLCSDYIPSPFLLFFPFLSLVFIYRCLVALHQLAFFFNCIICFLTVSLLSFPPSCSPFGFHSTFSYAATFLFWLPSVSVLSSLPYVASLPNSSDSCFLPTLNLSTLLCRLSLFRFFVLVFFFFFFLFVPLISLVIFQSPTGNKKHYVPFSSIVLLLFHLLPPFLLLTFILIIILLLTLMLLKRSPRIILQSSSLLSAAQLDLIITKAC